MFLATGKYTFPKLWGSGVPTSGSGYSWPRICASPNINFQSPLRRICMPVTRRNKQNTENGHKFMSISFNNLCSHPRIPIILWYKWGTKDNDTRKMIQITTYRDEGATIGGDLIMQFQEFDTSVARPEGCACQWTNTRRIDHYPVAW